jgi:hypothetical protein
MVKAKKTMKGMDRAQQELVEQLLGKLKNEQTMRLQSEEQHGQMMSQMVINQQHLEGQIKQLKDKSIGNMATTTHQTEGPPSETSGSDL